MHRTENYSQHSPTIGPVWLNGWVFVKKLKCFEFDSRCSHLNFRYSAYFEQGVLDIQVNGECGIALKSVLDMIKTNSQMHPIYKYSRHSSIIWSFCLNGWVFDYNLSGCGIESHCSHLNLRYGTCFEQQVPWHSDRYRVWIHSETRTWHDKNMQSNASYR